MKSKWLISSAFGKIILGLGLFVLLFGSYSFYVNRSRQINYRTFNIDDTVSWAETPQGIYRMSAQGSLDNLLLSKDSFRSATLSFELLNARDCGLIFHYQAPDRYDFIYFHQPTRSILLAQKEGEETHILKRLPFAFRPHFSCILKVTEDKSVLVLKDVMEIELPGAPDPGKIGILINDAENPRTIFLNAMILGVLSHGQSVSGRSPPEFETSGWGYLFSMLPFYIMMILAAFYLAHLGGWLNAGCRGGLHKRWSINYLWASLIHLGLAVFIFAPFIFRGEVLVSSYDNIGEIFPLFFFSKHKFMSLLSGGSWQLWNPFFHTGTPFWSSHWNMLFDPASWPIFLLPDSQVMFALTLRTFLQVFLIGVLAFGFFRNELGSSRWALISSIAYQLCSFLIFSFTIFPTISLYFAMTLYLYILWSFSSRRLLWNYALLTGALYLLFTSANVVFVFYAVLVLAAVSIYRILSVEEEAKTTAKIALAGWITALLLGSIRLLSCFWGIMHSNRIVDDYYTLQDRAFLFIRLFIPEIVGWFGADTFNALTSDKLELIFRQINLPSNSQNTFFVYFGIIPALLLICSFLLRFKKVSNFWKYYVFVTVASGLLWQPVWGIVSILCFPLNHYSYLIVIIPVGVCALIGHMGILLEREKISLKKIGAKLWLILILVQAYILTFLTYLFPQLTGFTRAIFLTGLAGFFIYKILRRYCKQLSRMYLGWIAVIFNSFIWVLLFFSSTLVLLKPFPRKEGLAQYFIVPLLSLLAVGTLALYFYYYLCSKRKGRPIPYVRLGVFSLLIPLALGCLFRSNIFVQLLQIPASYRIYISDVLLAQTRFFLLLQLAILSYTLARLKFIRMTFVIGILTVVTALDLLAFNMRFDNVSAPFFHNKAFYGSSFKYSDISQPLRDKMDLVNYRAHAQNRAGLNANKSIIFDIPSYTGTLGYLNTRFSNFINTFGYEPGTILIYPADISLNERFLDLSAVKYEFVDEQNIKERPGALARLNLFYEFEIIKEESPEQGQNILKRLSDKAFNIHQTVLLSEHPAMSLSAENRPSQQIPIDQASHDQIRASIQTDRGGIVLFNESYDHGWKAYVDDKSVEVLKANYNFMAIAVSPGNHQLVFKYEPRLFFVFAWVSIVALFIFVSILLFVFIKDRVIQDSQKRVQA